MLMPQEIFNNFYLFYRLRINDIILCDALTNFRQLFEEKHCKNVVDDDDK